MSTELVTLIKYSAISGPPKRRRREREKMPEQAERPMESKTSHTHTHTERKNLILLFLSKEFYRQSTGASLARDLVSVFFFAPSFDSFICVFILELDDETGEMKFVIGLELRVLSQRIRTKTG